MDEEFAEFFEEHDEDMGLKALFVQSSRPETSTSLTEMSSIIAEVAAKSLETSTSLTEMSSSIAEVAAESLEMGEKEDDPEDWMRIAIM